MFRYWYKKLLILLFGVKETVSYNVDCPTCGGTISGIIECDSSEYDCNQLKSIIEKGIERYQYIYTKNVNRTIEKATPSACSPPLSEQKIINTWNKCNYVGEVRHSRNGTLICLECGECGSIRGASEKTAGNSGGDSSNLSLRIAQGILSSSSHTNSATVAISDLPTGECMIDGSCPQSSCGYWYKLNNIYTKTSVESVKITNRERRNRQDTRNIQQLEERSGCGGECNGENDDCGSGCKCIKNENYNPCDKIKCKPNADLCGENCYCDIAEGENIGDCKPYRISDTYKWICVDDPSSNECECCDECFEKEPIPGSKCECCNKCGDPPFDHGDDGPGYTPSDCSFQYIYDDTGCSIIGIKPVLLARGKMAYWESTEKYPYTKDCDGNYIYGELAGKAVRHHKTPSRALEPHYLSRQTGVPSAQDPGNDERNNTYVRFIRFEILGIKARANTPKPLDQNNPYSILISPRSDGNKSVVASGLFINTFLGNIHGEKFAIPKNGVNSLEYFDKNIYYGGDDTNRGGENMDKGAMVFFAPDTQFDRPSLFANSVKLELGLFGKGFRHLLYGEGERPDSKEVARKNQKGTVQTINLSQYKQPDADKAINKCIVGASYAPASSVVDKGDDFFYPLLNLYRESSVYIEVKGGPVRLLNGTTKNQSDPNNGHKGKSLPNDGTSDYSFIGDTLYHACPVHSAAAWYGNIKTYNPSQYGAIVNRKYNDFYNVSWEDIETGSFTIGHGDSYINMHFIVRKSFLSDKIMEDVSPLIASGGLPSLPIIGTLLRKLFETVGLEECGTVPESGDFTDPRNGGNGMSGTPDAIRKPIPSQCWNGASPLPESTGKDIYFPNVLKTGISYIVESDVNLYYRGTGSIDAGEVYAKKLKGLNIHSQYPKDSDWEKGFLNRFYIRMNENPKWKMIFRVIVNIIWTYAIGIYIVIYGLNLVINSLSQANISWTDLNIGGWIGVALGIAIPAALGIGWTIFWGNSDTDNKFWDSMLGIDGCWPDIKEPKSQGGYRIKEGRVMQFEDNYYGYNWDYSKQNDIQVTLGLPDPYSTCDCETETTYEVLYSNKQNPLSITDAYRNFKVNSYIEVPSQTGKLKKMFRLGNRVFLQTSDAMFSLQTGASEMVTKEGVSVYLDNAKFLQKPVELFGGTKEGRGGTNDPNANEVTQWGYINIDVEARKIGLFDGSQYIELGEFGMSKFLDNFMPFTNSGIRDERSPNGIGYSIGIDNGRGIIFVTKKDKDVSWTLSYDVENKDWIGFEWFTPLLYTWDRFKIYSFNNGRMWRHNKVGEFNMVYGEHVPMIIDFVIRDKDTSDSFKWRNTVVSAEFGEWDGFCFVSKEDEFFSEIGAVNSFQSSGLMPTINHGDRDSISALEQNPNVLPVDNIHRMWRFNSLIDKVETRGVRLFSTWRDGIFTDFKDEPLGEVQTSAHFIDDYMLIRLIYFGNKNVRVLLKQVISEINNEQR
ncbi:MAG TPA: hypothetical protein PLO39_02925 [Saprospiraceae bacterium]|nr:hypothetical protein [Saprospiraceae bacterium]